MKKIKVGIETLYQEKFNLVKNRRVGLVTHPASVTSDLTHTMDILIGAKAKIEILFGPEHGFGGEAQDMETVNASIQGPTGIPVHSLYGASEKTLSPPKSLISNLDVVILDLADVGSRYYTFVWTAVLCLRACHAAGIDFVVLDRPNPLGGQQVEGAPQQPGFLSFVGLLPVPNRHGLTVGEITRMAAINEGLEDALTVVKMKGWQRNMYFEDTGLPWVLPSPNMPTVETAMVYPGLCLLEGTWASEGRGTTKPFEIFGAPEIDNQIFMKYLLDQKLPGVLFRPCSFSPTFQKHAQKKCNGVQLHVTDRHTFKPYLTGVATLIALKHASKEAFAWRTAPYEFISKIPAIDLLTGSETVRLGIESGASLEDISQSWASSQQEWIESATKLHLY